LPSSCFLVRTCMPRQSHIDAMTSVFVWTVTSLLAAQEKWEDNDCELLVRRRWSTGDWRGSNSEASSPRSRAVDTGAAVLPTDALTATAVATPRATLRAAALRVLGVQEHLYSFEIKSVSSLTPRKLSAPAAMTTMTTMPTSGGGPSESIPSALRAGGTTTSAVPEPRHSHSSALIRQRQHHERMQQHPPSAPEVWVPMVLRDQVRVRRLIAFDKYAGALFLVRSIR
jgi:hypothetical protein